MSDDIDSMDRMALRNECLALKEKLDVAVECLVGIEEHFRTAKVMNETISSLSRLTDFEVGLVQEAVKSTQEALNKIRGEKS